MQTQQLKRRPVDLASHFNETVERGHPADFPITLKPLFYSSGESFEPVPKRLAVVREDNGKAIAVVSDRYTLVPHQRILDAIDQAIKPMDIGPVPKGIYVDRQGARMRAIFKFPALAQPVLQGDDICPCLKIQNTYDGTSRIAIHIGAFRLVCTNLAVGGGGVFAGGFMSIHAGEIPLEKFTEQASRYLSGFDQIVETYRHWAGEWLEAGAMDVILEGVSSRHRTQIRQVFASRKPTAYEVYNAATYYATHETRSFRIAFDLLGRINRGFQKHFPPSPGLAARPEKDNGVSSNGPHIPVPGDDEARGVPRTVHPAAN